VCVASLLPRTEIETKLASTRTSLYGAAHARDLAHQHPLHPPKTSLIHPPDMADENYEEEDIFDDLCVSPLMRQCALDIY
jgi:hypothetical protein